MRKNHKKGIALLLAVLIGSIAIAISVGVFNVFFREIRITRGLTPSLEAFYASDAGGECALYWQIKENAFPFSGATSPIQCNGENITVTGSSGDYSFSFDFSVGSNQRCAQVRVRTNGGETCTRIDSYGTNRACGVTGQPGMVERGLVITDPVGCSL
ncbi:MAG: hypothetical protein COU90_00235 [Candidatus Ryanbacteria bacterium CG10_big_fil_rev_8_21_14_0_10_43_42]|uniref:Type 4 fimbrial biogenesis protein PilX N-terminal domain-containing protein n=1 Tax=Candidatus Ryanbacteria bacterium CG10_big_fil_rev_8_21_14_0_10_43_42 TaxID=1974864 RepID=A0A2M8KYC7_9BACT|nr:MAG: hypothetical protein COU90_00235 [Candidatus Ryanbacteria bacterium CG10_big_fil_rev_8_21_14_0_10_43_42]